MLVAQSCPALSMVSMDYSLPGSSVHGILQAKYWGGLLFPSPRDLPDPRSPASQADSLPSEPPGKPKLPKLGCPGPSCVGGLVAGLAGAACMSGDEEEPSVLAL